MKLEHLLLGLIGEHPATGYEIKKFLDLHGRFLRSNTTMSQVYRSLSTMTDRGWVAFTVDTRPGAQDAKIYRTTSEGMTVFLDWLTGPYAPPSRFQEPEFTARLSFAGYMTREQLIDLIDVELAARRDQVARYRFRDRTLNIDPAVAFDVEFASALGERLHQWGARQIDDYIETIAALRSDILDDKIVNPDVHAPATREGATR
ncbi:PadR family transcriptional regulator [Paramicrobacterium chengjingii]|uniref:PadR family transcriptional regulator n=1 Tax=Paramicrobacterium chengjingii TaxID=2769067 RepID=A0ABX6YHY9_9MICO|nr:PadR family transcriptional regulator [Microbacterium chengjingii]QPZ38382.1 PadR family transcriptional regulator [Microbacterium chengjingii]